MGSDIKISKLMVIKGDKEQEYEDNDINDFMQGLEKGNRDENIRFISFKSAKHEVEVKKEDSFEMYNGKKDPQSVK